jgi:hypothetical protein
MMAGKDTGISGASPLMAYTLLQRSSRPCSTHAVAAPFLARLG